MGRATGVKRKLSPDEKRLRTEEDFKDASKWGINMAQINDPDIEKENYGTSLSSGAKAAGNAMQEKIWKEERATLGQAIDDPRSRQAMREAGAEERREARGMKKGGKVRTASQRADGCAIRGKTRA